MGNPFKAVTKVVKKVGNVAKKVTTKAINVGTAGVFGEEKIKGAASSAVSHGAQWSTLGLSKSVLVKGLADTLWGKVTGGSTPESRARRQAESEAARAKTKAEAEAIIKKAKADSDHLTNKRDAHSQYGKGSQKTSARSRSTFNRMSKGLAESNRAAKTMLGRDTMERNMVGRSMSPTDATKQKRVIGRADLDEKSKLQGLLRNAATGNMERNAGKESTVRAASARATSPLALAASRMRNGRTLNTKGGAIKRLLQKKLGAQYGKPSADYKPGQVMVGKYGAGGGGMASKLRQKVMHTPRTPIKKRGKFGQIGRRSKSKFSATNMAALIGGGIIR